MKLSRRALAVTVAAPLLARPQTPPAATPDNDPVNAVRDAMKRNSEALAKVEIPIATEPAFQFRA